MRDFHTKRRKSSRLTASSRAVFALRAKPLACRIAISSLSAPVGSDTLASARKSHIRSNANRLSEPTDSRKPLRDLIGTETSPTKELRTPIEPCKPVRVSARLEEPFRVRAWRDFRAEAKVLDPSEGQAKDGGRGAGKPQACQRPSPDIRETFRRQAEGRAFASFREGITHPRLSVRSVAENPVNPVNPVKAIREDSCQFVANTLSSLAA